MTHSPLHDLAVEGQSVWIDYLSRHLVRCGELARLVAEDAVVGVTSNPTIFQKAISNEHDYDEQLRRELAETEDPHEAFLRLAERDIRGACDVLRPIFDRGGTPHDGEDTAYRDGFVSIEVDPALAYDTHATVEAAATLRSRIDRANLLVKIPATPPGLPAIEELTARGLSINVTLIFSLQRYTDVAEAYLRGLERLVAAGGDPSSVWSVASFFVSRVDTEADRRLDELGGHDGLRGKLAVANAKLAYRCYRQQFSGPRWQELADRGATTQRCLWASTSTKDRAYSDVKYVEELIGPDTVNTMPENTLRAFREHGRVRRTLDLGVDEAQRVLERFAKAGIDYDDVTQTLEREGVRAFEESFDELLAGIEERNAA